MPRKRSGPVAAPAPAAVEEKKEDQLHTVVISNIPHSVYSLVLLRAFKDAASGKGRVSVSQAFREILEDWSRREGPALMITGQTSAHS